ncbi:class I SAM-dependent DNA methyltransferase [Leptospira sp. GIMC2001]|uniref:class I SAM-dependent DNA methyltransferase n=1 Tax=Leptospira sp. GIMC2001 TaxID=1513297 RepID=UPI0023498F09|nr:class I SAM-dependent methyltransferase [Leptospira sp. GIMC2001]WCL50215.1 class I SAM-dependent methyltransferase [Leptospira sp. GIMC2001]
MKLYSELAEYYFDIEKPGRKLDEEIHFVSEVFKRHNVKSVVDIGCGSGEHVKDLQAMGFKIMGIDSSPKMIETAKNRFPHCRFEVGRMEDYKLKEPIDGLVCLFGTFNYLMTNDDIKKFFQNAYKNLKTAGILILDVWNAEPIKRIKRKPLGLVANIRVGETMIRRNRGFRLTRADDLTMVEVNYVYNLNKSDIKDKHVMRVFYPLEMETPIKEGKFEILNQFGGFSGEKFRKYGGRILYVLKKR